MSKAHFGLAQPDLTLMNYHGLLKVFHKITNFSTFIYNFM
jgi:hypothetical protein